ESEAQSWERHQASLLPQGEAQTVEDMGQLVVYLACAPHVTGQAIAVDGGFSL
ncbi:short-chain dehydrogenase, partial [Pseudomonas aeruginosa]|nr:short-chain dehydrogenase [Pseudomonas aeruginosa]